MSTVVLEIEDLAFAYPNREPLLAIESLRLERGASLFLEGPSGSGKSTLLALIAGILRPNRGSLRLLGNDLAQLPASRCDRLRAEHIGFIFQQFNLLPYLSLVENVILPLRFAPTRRARVTRNDDGTAAALALLERLGLGAEARSRVPVNELSVGQQQRVAAARALLGQPELLIADEPTSALDSRNRSAFIDLLKEETHGDCAVLFVSHDPNLAAHFDRHLDLNQLNREASADAR
ncbi:MAG: ABC transporter ATP-binding protein [Pseudomonadota bacterium]